MRVVSQALSDYLDDYTVGGPGVHLVTITLRDGFVQRITDHANSLAWSGSTWEGGTTGKLPAVTVGNRKEVAGTEVGSIDVTLLCGSDSELNGKRITSYALDGGFAGAWVKIQRAFLSSSVDIIGVMHLFDGPVAEANPSSYSVELVVESGMALLDQKIPRVTHQASCTHRVYDAGCTLDRAQWTVAGSVTSGSTALVVKTSTTNSPGYYSLGGITFTSGDNAGVERNVRAFDYDGTFYLDRPLPSAPAAGDAFSAWPGCFNTKVACQSKFNNLTHFRGEPLVPKNESGRIG